jgi:predicted alpha/beta-fold hydrolase
MPLVQNSTYKPPVWLRGGHLQTIYPVLFRRTRHVTQDPERLELSDGDFIDLEWSGKGSRRLAILSHGLEANTRAGYIQGMASALVDAGWDVLAWNFRGCGNEPNRLPRMYHSGATDDLHAVVSHALKSHPATSIDLIGFSLGGNLTLKYLGEKQDRLSNKIHRAVVFSVPCDLACSSRQLSRSSNKIYMERFLRALRSKIEEKNRRFPDQLDLTGLRDIRNFEMFDDRFTAPIHGFASAADYWEKNSSRQFIPHIQRETLLINAMNDPFLGPACHPFEEAAASKCFHFESPKEGGHVGFVPDKRVKFYWSENRTLQFLQTRNHGDF